MRFWLKLFLGYFAIIALGTYLFMNAMLEEIKPGLRQSMETSLVDTANLLAEIIAPADNHSLIDTEALATAVSATLKRPINATIWNHTQRQTQLRVYATNQKGIVIYDSQARDLGKDYSQWNDVYLTLQGEYGARSTQENPKDKFSSIMYIGAPIYSKDPESPQLVGVLTVGKPNVSVDPFWQLARDNIRTKGFWLLLSAMIAGALLSTLLSLSIRRLVRYAQTISEGKTGTAPRLYDPDLSQLATAMEQMRQALDGKKYIEDYTLSLTHEMKSPLTTLKGAAELMPVAENPAMREQLANNISQQTERLRALVDKVLSLARLENLTELTTSSTVNLSELIQQECQQLQLTLTQRQILLNLSLDSQITIVGDQLLLAQAIRNLLDNSLDFSPDNSQIDIQLNQLENEICLTIADQGSGIPEYALEQIWQRFYSLPRPDNGQQNSGQKSTGLGLSFVQQIAQLHHASIQLDNRDTQGAEARLTFTRPH